MREPSAFRLYALIAPLLYLAFALLTPPFQTPDEHQHLFRAWQIASGQVLAERRGDVSGGEVPAGLLRAAALEIGTVAPHVPERPLPRTRWSERFTRATPIAAGQPWVFADFLGSAGYSPAGYGPQVLAVWAGRALGFSVEAIVRLGRVFNAVLAYFLLCAAFRVLPVGRNVLLVVGLLPMTAACAGSFGQDALAIGGSAWLGALGVRALVKGTWPRGSAVTATVLAIAVTLAKFVYLPLAGLGMFLAGRNGRLRIAPAPAIAIGLAAAALLAWFALNSGLSAPVMTGKPTPGEQIAYMTAHPLVFPGALAHTYGPAGLFGMSTSLFTFGWLNIGPVVLAWGGSLFALALALARGERAAEALNWPWRLWALAICLVSVAALSLALYVTASGLASNDIYGLQGRYFIPLLLPLGLALLRPSRADAPRLATWIAALMVASNLFVLGAIADAFYI